jgi:putative two-component system response regulator
VRPLSTAPEGVLEGSDILVLDDDRQIVRLICRYLAFAGFRSVRGTSDPYEALRWIGESDPDLVLLDIHMPGLDGFGVLTHLQGRAAEKGTFPVLAITGSVAQETTRLALTLGATDLVRKPLDMAELTLRVRNLLEVRHLHRGLENERRKLQERVAERTMELQLAHLDSLKRLARAAEYRDDQTGQHTQRVGALAAAIALELGYGEEDEETIRIAASLHDVGKIGIPDEILLKPGTLTAEEFDRMKCHTRIGWELLTGATSEVMRIAAEVARTHHEWFNGAGYPDGLAGEAIPLLGRVVAVADFYDALTTARPYREAMPRETVLDEIERRTGTQFDPAVVAACFRCAHQMQTT